MNANAMAKQIKKRLYCRVQNLTYDLILVFERNIYMLNLLTVINVICNCIGLNLLLAKPNHKSLRDYNQNIK